MNADHSVSYSKPSELSDSLFWRLYADWFVKISADRGITLSARSGPDSENLLRFGQHGSPQVNANLESTFPFLGFHAIEKIEQSVVDEIAAVALALASNDELGPGLWYSTTLVQQKYSMSRDSLSNGFRFISHQIQIKGWRRIGTIALLEFKEDEKTDAVAPFAFPPAIVDVHVHIPGPCNGAFSNYVANGVLETIESICSFALGRPMDLPMRFFYTKEEDQYQLDEQRYSSSILGLARKGVSLDIYDELISLGGRESHLKLRAALMTYNAAVRQERDPVACMLYVIAAEALTAPFASWKNKRVTKRFMTFYEDLMSDVLDGVVANNGFEGAFGIRRGKRTAYSIRKELLNKIYVTRSNIVHEGVGPIYGGMTDIKTNEINKRVLLATFSEMAILRFISSPRVSLIGHPIFEGEPES